MAQQLEMRVVEQMHDVLFGPGEIVVQADDVATLGEQAFAQVRTEKAGAAGDENTFFQVHGLCLEDGLRWMIQTRKASP